MFGVTWQRKIKYTDGIQIVRQWGLKQQGSPSSRCVSSSHKGWFINPVGGRPDFRKAWVDAMQVAAEMEGSVRQGCTSSPKVRNQAGEMV